MKFLRPVPSVAILSQLPLFLLITLLPLPSLAAPVDILWSMGDPDNLAACTLTSGAETALAPSFALGCNLSATGVKLASDADAGYTAVTYDPQLVLLTPSTRVTAKTAGHCVTFSVTPTADHTFKPLRIEFDAAKCGTDGGNFDVCIKSGTGAEKVLQTGVAPLRNKVGAGNSTGKSHHVYEVSKQLVEAGQPFQLILYVYNFNGQDATNPKSIAFSNVTISGATDEPLDIPTRPAAKPLNRGLLAVKTSAGVLVSWRLRAADNVRDLRFRLYRGKTLITKTPVMGKTNYLDTAGSATSVYTLEVVDGNGKVIDRQEGVKTWDSQTMYITLQGGAPTDPTSAGATYTPNDASFCDMDGDGEYEIVMKWTPSNEKDAASSGTTSPAFYACYKMDGTRLWMLHTGQNMFNSAHTAMFIAWDMDGDGYGEFMVKTAPGAIDGEGKYILLDGDNPNDNLKSGRGKQDHGSEYLTIFDGTTGAELQTIRYHTAYADETTSFWGDSNQNRCERYLAAIAWLDGEDQNPSAIFARGYYSGCKIGAYDWDGTNLTLRWLHRGTSANSGTVTYADGTVKTLSKSVYGEGCHWISVGDVTGDGRQEIHYGSGALNADGTTLYRTGLGHGDAIHLGDFIPSRPGQEYFMVHEHSPYGSDLRDARTGEILLRRTASGDTGRGIMAHFNPEAENAYWQSSADAGLYDTDGNTILATCNHGGGAGLSFRIYWNDDLADDFYGKNIIEYWNASANGFWRMQINGGNYVPGNYNNSSKQNPCVSGDLLGDWREEIVTWDQTESGDYRLVVSATGYQTPYGVPHLMDDAAYRAQLISQNVCYNQPPHLSYDLRTRYTIERAVPASGWDVLHTSYPVRLPEGVTAYNLTGVNASADTVRITKLAARATLPAGVSVLYKAAPGALLKFVPTTNAAATVSSTYLKGCSVDSVVVCNEQTYEYFYTFRANAETGEMGFYKIEEPTRMPAGTPWLRVKGSATNPPLPQYYATKEGIPTAIRDLPASPSAATLSAEPTVHDLDGRRIPAATMQHGRVYIVNGEKIIY